MSQKNRQQLLEQKAKLEETKAKLEAVKANQPDKWTDKLQVKLDETIGEIADLSEEIAAELQTAIKELADTNAEKKMNTSSYLVPKGTENLAHLKIHRGHRFDPSTGKELTKSYIQLFRFGEYRLFMANYKKLGYTIDEELHVPQSFKK